LILINPQQAWFNHPSIRLAPTEQFRPKDRGYQRFDPVIEKQPVKRYLAVPGDSHIGFHRKTAIVAGVLQDKPAAGAVDWKNNHFWPSFADKPGHFGRWQSLECFKIHLPLLLRPFPRNGKETGCTVDVLSITGNFVTQYFFFFAYQAYEIPKGIANQQQYRDRRVEQQEGEGEQEE
jgi:hypothetical protein